MNRRSVLLASTIAFLAAAGEVGAQEASGGTQLQEVVVTAQRRAERLTDVPMTVSVVTTEQVQQRGITDTRGLQRTTGGLQLQLNGSFMAPALRGVSTAITQPGATSNVAFYLDGVYQPTQVGQLMDLADVAQIQILKGPQGTLYGQNAAGGAIVINTLEPGFTPTGKLIVGYGNFNDIQAKGYISGPIIGDVVAGSLAISYETHDGFRRGVVDGKRAKGLDQRLIRGKILFKPTDTASITLTGYYTRQMDSSMREVSFLPGQGIAERIIPQYVLGLNLKKQFAAQPAYSELLRSYGMNLRGKFDVGVGDLDIISAYQNIRARLGGDVDYSAINHSLSSLVTKQPTFIQEVDFVSRKFGRASITSGLYYQNSSGSIAPNVFELWAAPPFIPPTVYPASPPNTYLFYQSSGAKSTHEVFAGFAELTYDVTDQFVVSAGARYTQDEAHGYYSADWPAQPYKENVYSPQRWTNFSPRVTARYKLTDDSNIYATYAKGFKSGVLNTNGDANLPVNPEKLTSYEIGYKGTLFGRLYLNLSGFWINYNDKQVAYYIPPAYVTQNAASARIKGADLDFRLAVTPELTLNGSLEYLDAKYRSFAAAGVYVPDPSTGGLQNAALNLSGKRMDRAPKFSGSVTADYRVATDAGRFGANVSLYHSSAVNWEPSGRVRQKAYELLDGEVSFSPASMPNVRFSVWGSNLTNQIYLMTLVESPYAAGVGYSPPRQFGIRVQYDFNR